jgi:hypothetical protein
MAWPDKGCEPEYNRENLLEATDLGNALHRFRPAAVKLAGLLDSPRSPGADAHGPFVP